jgi:hypothetical protein
MFSEIAKEGIKESSYLTECVEIYIQSKLVRQLMPDKNTGVVL